MRCLVFCCCVTLLGCSAAKDSSRKERKPPDAGAGAGAPESSALLRNGTTRLGKDKAGRKGSDWPRFLGPTASSVSTEKGIIAPWPKDGLRIVWYRRTFEGYASPTISKGRLYLFERQGDTARLNCLKSATGAFVWKFEYPTEYTDRYSYSGGPRCCPVVDDDRVYIYGPEGMLHCLRTADGKPVWKIDTVKQYGVVQNFFGVGSTPVVEGDLLIAQVGGSPKGSEEVNFAKIKGNGTALVAFDKRTGKEKWRLSKELASYATPVLATIGKRRWCFVLARGGLIAFNPATGKEDFHFPWRARSYESVNASNPVVIGERVFLSECYGPGSVLLQVKPGGYKVLWSDKNKGRDKSMQCHWMTPIYHKGYLYGCSGRHENAVLRCIELATGKEMWSEPDLTRTSLLMVDGHFVCLGENGVLRLLKVNPKKYEEVSKMGVYAADKDGKPDRQAGSLLRYPCWAAPVLSHGLMYVRGKKHLVCLELIPAKK